MVIRGVDRTSRIRGDAAPTPVSRWAAARAVGKSKQSAFYREWLDSFFARDIQRLFGFRDMNRFNAMLEFMLRQSGGQFGVTKTASALGISRPTVESHLRALKITHAVTVVRPFHGGGHNEIVRQPRFMPLTPAL